MFRRSPFEMRVLILAPVGRDAPLLAQTVASLGCDTVVALDADMLLRMMDEGFGAAIVAEEALPIGRLHDITQWLSRQPPGPTRHS